MDTLNFRYFDARGAIGDRAMPGPSALDQTERHGRDMFDFLLLMPNGKTHKCSAFPRLVNDIAEFDKDSVAWYTSLVYSGISNGGRRQERFDLCEFHTRAATAADSIELVRTRWRLYEDDHARYAARGYQLTGFVVKRCALARKKWRKQWVFRTIETIDVSCGDPIAQ